MYRPTIVEPGYGQAIHELAFGNEDDEVSPSDADSELETLDAENQDYDNDDTVVAVQVGPT